MNAQVSKYAAFKCTKYGIRRYKRNILLNSASVQRTGTKYTLSTHTLIFEDVSYSVCSPPGTRSAASSSASSAATLSWMARSSTSGK